MYVFVSPSGEQIYSILEHGNSSLTWEFESRDFNISFPTKKQITKHLWVSFIKGGKNDFRVLPLQLRKKGVPLIKND